MAPHDKIAAYLNDYELMNDRILWISTYAKKPPDKPAAFFKLKTKLVMIDYWSRNMRNDHFRSIVQNKLRVIGLIYRFIVKHRIHPINIKRLAPLRHYQCGNTIANEVGQGTRLRHEAVNTENQGKTGHRYSTNRRECCS